MKQTATAQPLLIAMIPARLGSKRIPRKNLRLLHNKPLLQYAIELARDSGCFAQIFVNSESDLLGELAVRCGAKFHKRPAELSSDQATNQHFTAEFLEKHRCDFLVMLNPTSPLLRVDTVKSFCRFVRQTHFDTIFSVVDEYAECFWKGAPLNFSLEGKVNSQDLPPVRKVVWALTAWRRKTFLQAVSRNLCGTYAGEIGLFPIPKDESCDLDTPQDWAIAEGILSARSLGRDKIAFWPCEDKRGR